jgi:hypothetical protein
VPDRRRDPVKQAHIAAGIIRRKSARPPLPKILYTPSISIFENSIKMNLNNSFSPSENQGFSPRATLKSKKGNGVEENRI